MKSQNELISVGMPVYNGGQFLKQAIRSILSQSYTNLELIISDDASSDNSAKIYEECAKKDKRIRIFQHKKNIGQIVNFNFVLKQAKGEYFMWTAQDDFRDKKALEKLFTLHKTYPDTALAVSNYKNVHNDISYFVYPEFPYNNTATKAQTLISFLKTDNLSFFYGLHKTKILKKTGGYFIDSRPIFKSSDFITIYNVLLKGKLVYTPEVLFFKRDTGFFTNQFNTLSNLEYSQTLLKKIYRYLFFPVFFIYDFIFATIFLIKSDLSLPEKIQVEFWLLWNTLNKCRLFIVNSVVGIWSVLKGILKKLL